MEEFSRQIERRKELQSLIKDIDNQEANLDSCSYAVLGTQEDMERF